MSNFLQSNTLYLAVVNKIPVYKRFCDCRLFGVFQSSQGLVFGCDRELHTQFNSTASLWFQVPNSPSPTLKKLISKQGAIVPLLAALICCGPGSNPEPPDLGVDTLNTAPLRPFMMSASIYWVTIQCMSPSSNHCVPLSLSFTNCL